jgi:magnesium-transporting ATPase (P-type)
MVTGDNLLTALNVARICNIVPKKNKVIFVDAHPPVVISDTEFEPAKIDWRLAEPYHDLDDQTNGIQVNTFFYKFIEFIYMDLS